MYRYLYSYKNWNNAHDLLEKNFKFLSCLLYGYVLCVGYYVVFTINLR